MSGPRKRLGCSISPEAKAKLTQISADFKLRQGETLDFLILNFGSDTNQTTTLSVHSLDLSDAELAEVQTALTNSDSTLELVAKEGLLQRSRYLNSIADKQSRLESMTPEEINKATFKGAAQFKIEHAIQKVIEHNDAQPEKSNKVCLTKGIIFKLTGSNRATINQYFDHHQIMIADHNQKHGLTKADNRKGKGFSFEQLLGI